MILKKLDNIEIRPLVLSDLNDVKIIRDQCLDFIHDNKSYSLDETINWYLNTLPHYLSVLYDTKLVGYFRLTNITSNSCYVGMDLHLDYRGKGIALKTYNIVLEELSKYGIDTFYLKVLSNNTHAIRLYEYIGFKIISNEGNIVRYNENNILNLLMSKTTKK
jgi:ribosomal protein S18 acetylase RimI-like enzyme